MMMVYSNACCSIAANGATDSSKGLFFSREPRTLPISSLNLPANIFKNDGHILTYVLGNKSALDDEFNGAPLLQRAWVVQERLLPPRVLHFGARQLLWECRSSFATEVLPRGVPASLLGKNARFKMLDGFRASDDPFWAHRFWNNVVETFSACLLTQPGDKLIAMAGMAQVLTPILGSAYVAGLWRQHLIPSLLWRRASTPYRTTRPAYRAPSFSWAAIDGRVFTFEYFAIADAQPLVEVLDVRLTYATDDVFGPVTGGYLRLRGRLGRLRLRWAESDGGPEVVAVAGRAPPPDVPRADARPWDARKGMIIFPDVGDDEGSELAAANEGGCLYYVPVWRYADVRLELLLLACTHPGKGLFRRVGIANVNREEAAMACLEHDEEESRLPCERYEKEARLHDIVIE